MKKLTPLTSILILLCCSAFAANDYTNKITFSKLGGEWPVTVNIDGHDLTTWQVQHGITNICDVCTYRIIIAYSPSVCDHFTGTNNVVMTVVAGRRDPNGCAAGPEQAKWPGKYMQRMFDVVVSDMEGCSVVIYPMADASLNCPATPPPSDGPSTDAVIEGFDLEEDSSG